MNMRRYELEQMGAAIQRKLESMWDDKIPVPEIEPITDDTAIIVNGYGKLTLRHSYNELDDIIMHQGKAEFTSMNIAQLEIARAHLDAIIKKLKN